MVGGSEGLGEAVANVGVGWFRVQLHHQMGFDTLPCLARSQVLFLRLGFLLCVCRFFCVPRVPLTAFWPFALGGEKEAVRGSWMCGGCEVGKGKGV